MILIRLDKSIIKKTFSNVSTLTNLKNYKANINFNNNLRIKLLHIIFSPNLSQNRNYRSFNSNYVMLLPNDSIKIFPNLFKYLTLAFKSIFLLTSYNIDMKDFQEASTQAACIVSTALTNEDYESLKEMVSEDVIENLKNHIHDLSENQRKSFSICRNNIMYSFPYEMLFTYDNGRLKFVEILMIITSIPKLEEAKKIVTNFTPFNKIIDKPELLISNYQFIYEFKEHEESYWKVNKINSLLIL